MSNKQKLINAWEELDSYKTLYLLQQEQINMLKRRVHELESIDKDTYLKATQTRDKLYVKYQQVIAERDKIRQVAADLYTTVINEVGATGATADYEKVQRDE